MHTRIFEAVVIFLLKMPRKVTREVRAVERVFKTRNRKRKQVFNPKTADADDGGASTSAKKLKVTDEYHVPKTEAVAYKIINFMTVFSTIASLVKCAKCNSKISFGIADERGLGFKISVVCDKCTPQYIRSCDLIKHSYEVNRRFILAMRVLGIGYKGAVKFCGLMDFPPFLYKRTYQIILKHIYEASKNMARYFTKKACTEEIDLNSTDSETKNTDLIVSGDGTWHKRGFSSLFGVTSLIGNYTGKVIDVLVKSSYCKACECRKNIKNTNEYKVWYNEHKNTCAANHEGSAGKMEVDAVIEMFRNSLKNLGVRFLYYVGDGDSKTYTGILKAAPYGETEVIKKECVGHIQKRMGTRLRGCKKTHGNLGGKGKLTDKLIDKLSVYFGKAIRDNCDSVEKMHNAIWATLYHKSSTDKKPQHHMCPPGADSWCKYNQAKANRKLRSFKHDYTALPLEVVNAIKPIYDSLTKKELLERCIGGFTQNSNESFNQIVWKIMPKTLPGSFITVSIAANVATCTFNEGTRGLLSIFDAMGIHLGPHAHAFAKKEDATRIQNANRRSLENTKEARVARRQLKFNAAAATKAKEGVVYGPGIGD